MGTRYQNPHGETVPEPTLGDGAVVRQGDRPTRQLSCRMQSGEKGLQYSGYVGFGWFSVFVGCMFLEKEPLSRDRKLVGDLGRFELFFFA